jgi:predicted transcriptional regulator
MSKNRDKSQLKFKILLQIKDNPLGISKYMLKKNTGIPTTKQFNQLIEDLLEKSYVRVEQRDLPGNTTESGNYYYLEPKAIEFIEKAEELLIEFLDLDKTDTEAKKNYWGFQASSK